MVAAFSHLGTAHPVTLCSVSPVPLIYPTRPLPHVTDATESLTATAEPTDQKTKKPLKIRGFLPAIALACQTGHHSHSIVAGGLPEMSYTTRLIPRTSLMIRFDTLPSKACGKCAHCAVMKSSVCTARSATTYS